MKRIPRDPEKFEVIDLFAAIGGRKGFSLTDEGSKKSFLETISKSLTVSRENPIILHGRRTEEMFGYIAASLGKCVAVKQEDKGEPYVEDIDIQIPDYRIVTRDGYEFFAEVKNCRQRIDKDYVFKIDYIKRLKRYGYIFKHDMKIAIYWSYPNIWTLSSVDMIPFNGNRFSISIGHAAKINEMATLGDYLIGTTPPLSFRILTDSSKPRFVNPDGQVEFTIGEISFFCSGIKIDKPLEKALTYYFLLYGNWASKGPIANIENNELISIDIVAEPLNRSPNQGFETVGYYSSMISRRYTHLLESSRGDELISLWADPDSLSITIPSDYKGDHLPLWRFIQRPNLK